MAYTHLDVIGVQSAKEAGQPCGDVFQVEHTPISTIVVLSDGLGSGIQANLAAILCVSRIMELIRQGHSLRETFAQVLRTMNEARGSALPYAVFSILQFRHDGETVVLSYEMPPPIYVGRHASTVLHQQTHVQDNSVVAEAHCYIEPGEGILIVSDGITQAGLGQGLRLGWTIEGVSEMLQSIRGKIEAVREIPESVHHQARKLWRQAGGDDCTAVLAWCRKGSVVNVFTGPPSRPSDDREVVRRFLGLEGTKIVCGGTTARLVAEGLGRSVEVIQDETSLIAPPRYSIEGIDLVTEGAVTLNQAYNIFDEEAGDYTESSGVTRLCGLLKSADRVNFLVGMARNDASAGISFRQQGILPRKSIVPLLAEQLRKQGKFVSIECA